MKEILKNIHLLSLGGVNAYLIDHDELTLIDTGYSGNTKKILTYIKKIGKSPSDLTSIIITHLHTDHTGSLAELKKATGAKIFMTSEDAKMIEKGKSFREKLEISPGFFNKLMYGLFVRNAPRTVMPVKVDQYIHNGDEHLKIDKGFTIVPVPGHAYGQIALKYHDHGGILFAADTSGNVLGLGIAPFYENYRQGLKDILKLTKLDFEVIVFGHGKPVIGRASEKFIKTFNKILLKENVLQKSGNYSFSESKKF